MIESEELLRPACVGAARATEALLEVGARGQRVLPAVANLREVRDRGGHEIGELQRENTGDTLEQVALRHPVQ